MARNRQHDADASQLAVAAAAQRKTNLLVWLKQQLNNNPFLPPQTNQILTVTASDGVAVSPGQIQHCYRTAHQYRQLPRSDPRHIQWRKKLAAGLTAFYQAQNGIPAQLWDLPDGYSLMVEKEYNYGRSMGAELLFLYGHPLGIDKRFGSTETFLPHLRWIVAGMSPGACICRSCTQYYTGVEPK